MKLARKLRRSTARKTAITSGQFVRVDRLDQPQTASDAAATHYGIGTGLPFIPANSFAVEDLFTVPKSASTEPRTGPTGPRTPQGKARSCLNNLRHGLAGAFRVLADESQSEFDNLSEALRDEHQPATATEAILVQRLAEHVWLSRRAQNLQDAAISSASPANLGLFLRYQTTHDRAFHKCLAELFNLRKQRRRDFESQNAEAASDQPLRASEFESHTLLQPAAAQPAIAKIDGPLGANRAMSVNER